MTGAVTRAVNGVANGPATTAPVDPRTPAQRLARLLDPGSPVPLHHPDTTGVHAVEGRVDGLDVIAFCTDATVKGGALGADGAGHVVDAVRVADATRRPVIGLWHSGGAQLTEGVRSMDGVGRMFAAITAASGRVPQLSVVLGPAAGAAAYGPALTDVVIMSEDARVFITGPDVTRSVTGELIDMASLGGPAAHGRRSGVAHVTAPCEADALQRARDLAVLLGRPGRFDPAAGGGGCDLRRLLPASKRRAYDVHPLVDALLDPGSPTFAELLPDWAPNMVVGLGRLAGRTVGVVANNPIRKGGCLDSPSAEKAARFVRMCDALGVPLAVLVDVPGYLPGVTQEWEGVVRRGAKLLHAFAEAVVPRVTLITRKAYGGAYIAMNSRSLGADAVFAWPDAEVAVMGPEAAVDVLHRRELGRADGPARERLRAELAERQRRTAGGVDRALEIGVVDAVVEPARTREHLVRALAAVPDRRGRHTNIPI